MVLEKGELWGEGEEASFLRHVRVDASPLSPVQTMPHSNVDDGGMGSANPKKDPSMMTLRNGETKILWWKDYCAAKYCFDKI